MTNQEAFDALRNALRTGGVPARSLEFAQSLVYSFHDRGWSDKQAFWARKLAIVPTEAPAEAPTPDCAQIIGFMDRASRHLKYPKIKLSIDGEPFVLSRAGERSRTPGAVQLTDGGPYGDNVWYGRIERDGTFTQSARCTPEVMAVLQQLATDPAAVAKAHGQAYGQCCFCRRALEDYRSVSMGYGPICAEHYGLPWGERTEGLSEYHEERTTG
jgi:hypothetical protein